MQGDFFVRSIRLLVPGDVPDAIVRGVASTERNAMPGLRTTHGHATVAPSGLPNPTLRRCWVGVMKACKILSRMPNAFDLLTRLTSRCPGHDLEAIEGADHDTAVRALHRAARRMKEEQAHTLRALGQDVLAHYDGDADAEDRAAIKAADGHRLIAKFCAVLLALRALPEAPLGAEAALPEAVDFLAALASSSGVAIGSRPVLFAPAMQSRDCATQLFKRKRDALPQARDEVDMPPRKRPKLLAAPSIPAPENLRADVLPAFEGIAAMWDEIGAMVAMSRANAMLASPGGATVAPTALSRKADIADSLENPYKPSVLCQRWTDYASTGFPVRHARTASLVRSILLGIDDGCIFSSKGFNDEVCRVVGELGAYDQVFDLMNMLAEWERAPQCFPAGKGADAMEELVKCLVQALFW